MTSLAEKYKHSLPIDCYCPSRHCYCYYYFPFSHDRHIRCQLEFDCHVCNDSGSSGHSFKKSTLNEEDHGQNCCHNACHCNLEDYNGQECLVTSKKQQKKRFSSTCKNDNSQDSSSLPIYSPGSNFPTTNKSRSTSTSTNIFTILCITLLLTILPDDLIHKKSLKIPFLEFASCQLQTRTRGQQQVQVPSQITSSQRVQVVTLPDLIAQQGGIIKDKNLTLTKQFNPVLVTKDIIIKKDAKLTIESGTELFFDRKIGITVYGTLEILGQHNDRVKLGLLKSQQSPTINFRSQNNHPHRLQQVRLVDGDLPNEGRVQVKFNDRWHSLCTDSKNLTAADIKVLCRQVGYQEGFWYKWFPQRNITIPQIMAKSLNCSGDELTLQQCNRWTRIRTGGGICDFQSDIGIRCSRKLAFSSSDIASFHYWKGIEFITGETFNEYVLDGHMRQKTSRSKLNYVTISQAGLNEVGNATAAIRVTGQPPRMNEIEIKDSVYGILVEEADDAIYMSNIKLVNNMASPLFINSSWGKVTLDKFHVEDNGGDGIRVTRHEKVIMGSHDFCQFANLAGMQSYPVILSHEQTFFTVGRNCCQEFFSDNQLTVHFQVLRSTPNNLLPEGDNNRRVSIPQGVNIGKDAHLVIFDEYRDDLPYKLRVQNNTRANSIVSRSGRMKICYEPAQYRTVLFTIIVVEDSEDEWTSRARDVEIRDSFIKGNEGRGIWIENPRSGLKLLNTTLINHNYLCGLHVENGTGEVIIQGSTISNNTGHGVFINLAGGYYHIDNSTISDNSMKGVLLDYDKRPEVVPFNHTFHMGYSLIARNGENGLFIGNVCRSDASWNISMNSFIKNGEDALVYQSCLPKQDYVLNLRNMTSRLNMSDSELSFYNNYQELFITHNIFLANTRRAISMSPVFYVKTFIRHNIFKEHQLAVLYVSNQVLPNIDMHILSQAPVNIRIASNRFYHNHGRYVANIGLHEDNPKHSLTFTKNFLEDNQITEPYSDLKPRSRVSAVVVVSSSNTRVIRNRFDNPQSNFEFGSHLEMHHKIINATTNFWGRGLDAASIYRRIFDRKNRYNLAQVEFLQYLLSPEDLEYASDLSFDRERDKISIFRNGTRLGGEVKGYEELRPETYIVQDDIFIRPGGHLILKPGTSLKFQDGIGMMVQGRLDALGQRESPIIFTSALSASRVPQRAPMTTTLSPLALPWVSHQSDGFDENDYNQIANSSQELSFQTNSMFRRPRQISSSSNTGSQNVRLSHTTMGRLEVQVDGSWGPVCDYSFDINDAAVACQQMGMILNKDDWLLEKFQYAANDHQQVSMLVTDVLMTNIRCDPSLDTDITKCKAELSSRGDFDGMCNSVVGIRCFPPSWSGLRLGMGAEISTIEHVTIQRAGMFDYALHLMNPALQIDFNRHLITSLTTKSNSDSGMGIFWNDVIGRHHHELTITDSKFLNNERHGVDLKSRGMSFKGCQFSNNRQSGLNYNPTFSQDELNDLLSWLYTSKMADNIVNIQTPILDNRRQFSIPSSEESYKFFVLQKNPQPNIKEGFTIGTDPGHMLSIHLINPIHPHSTESLNMSIGNNLESPIWDLRINMTSFPMVSPGYKFHFNYTTGSKPKGNIILYIRSRYNNRDLKLLAKHIPAHLVMPKFEQTAININTKLINSLTIKNSNVTKNGIGLKFRHPNYSYGPQESYNRRYANESTIITGNNFDGNYFSSIFVGSDDYELHTGVANKSTAASEIHYYLSGNKIRRNKDGIRQFSRDLRQSNNIFHWSVNETLFEQNKGGGINIVLPYFWPYDANLSHTMEFHNNSFLKNTNFEFSLDGHFVALNVTNNNFRDNRCRLGLISLNGMEKKILMRHNFIENNACSRIMDFNIQSHADKMGFVTAQFEFNSIRYNRKPASTHAQLIAQNSLRNPNLALRLHPQSSDYALSLKGVQAVNITRNLFVNPELRYELVVGIIMDPEERTVRAVENYWGYTLQSEISDRIFDFDDWNCFAVAEISPCLTQESFSSAIVLTDSRDNLLRPISKQALGGRLTKSLTLPYRKEPYLVESDLTVMPNVRLTIEKGVTLEFMPSVGILVLGDLVAAGSRDRPIQMKQALSSTDVMPFLSHLFPPKMKPTLTLPNINDPLIYEHNYALRHYQLAYPIDLGSIRLCKNEICNDGTHIYDNNVEDPVLRQEVLKSSNNSWKMDGFLEIYNMTTLQWVPVCDPLFTEYTAKVVCRQLGYSHLSIFKRGRRYTIEQQQIISIKNWPESLQCEGDESNLVSCPLATDGFTNHSTECTKEGNQFIYVHCSDYPEGPTNSIPAGSQLANHGLTNEHAHHWGGIRFSCPSLSTTSSSHDPSHEAMLHAASAQSQSRSRIQYVTIEKAGMLHRKKAPALQVLQCAVQVEYVAVTNSAHHGIEIITSLGNQNFHQLRIRNNLGIGFNYLALTGSSSASRLVPYLPLKHLDISSDIFGLVDICGANKEITIEERLILFYRYNSLSVDCVKIVTSKFKIKHIGMRLLQFDLFNSTGYTGRPDSLRVYDGNIFDRDSRLIVDLGVTERHRVDRPELKFYQSTDSTMTVRLHASGAGPLYGFIAEVVTTPVSYNIQRDTYNNITFSEITNNKLGALTISSAGESSPNLILKNNRFESNCMHLFGNFTSCTSPVYMEVQNCQRMRIFNNLFKGNQGGLTIKSYSHSAVSALEAAIDNNVFESNQNTYTLALLGPKTDPYQTVIVTRNFFTRNVAPYLSDIILSRIVANFSQNILSSNIGKHQIEVVGFDKLPLSYQTFFGNWIYNNSATYERDRSTIFGNSAGQQYYMNYLVNPDNHFEISTMNWSRYDVRPLQVPRDDEIIHLAAGDGSTKDLIRKTVDSIPINIIDTKKIDLYHATINAKQNWWGFNTTGAIQGRIRDRVQHEELIKVDFAPFLGTNRSVLSGICAGGWQRVGNSCLFYIGSRMTYHEAREFCDRERATLPILHGIGHFSLGNHRDLTDFIKLQDREYDPRIDRVWVRSFDVGRDVCPALNDHLTKNYDCQERHSFICEKDTLIVVRLMQWYRETGGLIAFVLAVITITLTACCTMCWAYKSRQRYKEKLQRKSSIYASMRGSHLGPHSSSNSLSELFLHRQIYNHEKSSITDLSLSTQTTQPGSDHSANLIRLDPSYRIGVQERKIDSSSMVKTKPRSSVHSQAQEPVVTLTPTYASARPAEVYFESQPSLNSPYVQQPPPALSSQQSAQTLALSSSYDPEPYDAGSNISSSRTTSYTSPQTSVVAPFVQPRAIAAVNNEYRPQRTPSIVNLAPTYTQIDHTKTLALSETRPPLQTTSTATITYQPETYPTKPGATVPPNYGSNLTRYSDNQALIAEHQPQFQEQQQQQQPKMTSQPQNESSESSAPTYYSNQVDTTFEESTQSYLEAYHNAYNETLERLQNDQVNYMITEHSSLTDLLINSNQLVHTSSIELRQNVADAKDTEQYVDPYVAHDVEEYESTDLRNFQPPPSSSEAPSGSQPNRFVVETSFDYDEANGRNQSSDILHDNSHQLEDASSTNPTQDSKSKLRVYLETSFESD